MRRHGRFIFFALLVLLQGCGSVRSLPSELAAAHSAQPPAGFFVPSGAFGKATDAAGVVIRARSGDAADTSGIGTHRDTAGPRIREVLLYDSPTTRAYFLTGGLGVDPNIRIWLTFLRKYGIPHRVLSAVEPLEKMQAGVLLLPSSVALSERERQAIMDFRGRGGGILASWLTGVRDEAAQWRGFGFMAQALDVGVVGDTSADPDDNFLLPHGDNPVTHSLAAGRRVWLERVPGWYPLRLDSRHAAAQIMSWSRTFVAGKQTTSMVFDERAQPSGALSRTIVLGYPERLWASSDPRLMEAIAHNALTWLLRETDAYIAAWPYPYASGLLMAVDSPDVVAPVDSAFAKKLEEAGGRATYYVLSENALKSAQILKELQARGHEIAFLGDRFKGFRDQSPAEQEKRLETMRRELAAVGLPIVAGAGFHAPMESMDETTRALLRQTGFGHYVSFMDESESRLPFIATGAATQSKALVVLPRTQNGAEDLSDGVDVADGVPLFLGELALAEKMAGLSVVRIPNQTLLSEEERDSIFAHLTNRSESMWMSTGANIADWWRERERVSMHLDSVAAGVRLTVEIKGQEPLRHAVTVLINLPEHGATLRLIPQAPLETSPKVGKVDDWRAAVVLQGWPAGVYHWVLKFDSAQKNSK